MSEAGDRRMYGENREEQEKGHEVEQLACQRHSKQSCVAGRLGKGNPARAGEGGRSCSALQASGIISDCMSEMEVMQE